MKNPSESSSATAAAAAAAIRWCVVVIVAAPVFASADDEGDVVVCFDGEKVATAARRPSPMLSKVTPKASCIIDPTDADDDDDDDVPSPQPRSSSPSFLFSISRNKFLLVVLTGEVCRGSREDDGDRVT